MSDVATFAPFRTHEQDSLTYVRLRCKKHDLIMAPGMYFARCSASGVALRLFGNAQASCSVGFAELPGSLADIAVRVIMAAIAE